MPNKTIIVINGKGGVGKDTLLNSLNGRYHIANASSVDPIKEIARQYGWNGEKDNRSRRFLAELKQTFLNYNDLPNTYLKARTEEFLNSDDDILFVHIREAEQIDYYKELVKPARCVTLLIRRKEIDNNGSYNNHADDDVENYCYDYIFENDLPEEESKEIFYEFIRNIHGGVTQ